MDTIKGVPHVRRIGEKALTFRFPIVNAGEVSFLDPDTFAGRWLILSFLPTLRNSNLQLWNRQGQELAKLGTVLLVVPGATLLDYASGHLLVGQTHFML